MNVGHTPKLMMVLLRLLIKGMLSKRGLNTIRLTKILGHADDEMVRLRAAKQVDKDGNDRADEAADSR